MMRVTLAATATATAAALLTALTAAGCAATGGAPPAATSKVAAVTPAATAASSSPSPSPSPSPSRHLTCRQQLTAWLAAAGTQWLDAIHQDLSNYSKDDGAVVGDLINGGNIQADITTWTSDLAQFESDAAGYQDNPAPSCAGGHQLALAAADWAAAAVAYGNAAQILSASPNLSGVSQSDPDVNAGNADLTRAQRALRRAISQSGGRIPNVIRGTGT